jgi:hypothetical protein
MAANRELAEARGLDEDAIRMIDYTHAQLEWLIDNLALDQDIDYIADVVRHNEFELQRLWGFTQDSRYHTWGRRLSKRVRELAYLGAVYRCKESGESLTIDKEALEGGALFGVGHGFIDFGGVVRIVGPLERIK